MGEVVIAAAANASKTTLADDRPGVHLALFDDKGLQVAMLIGDEESARRLATQILEAFR